MVEINDLKKSFKDKNVLLGIGFELRQGEITAFVGKNGAGKTTTIKCICGINSIDSGKVDLKNNRIGVVFDDNGLYLELTAFENLVIFQQLIGKSMAESEKAACELLKSIDLLNEKDKKVKHFSKGMKRRLALARMIVFDPNILILDEPFDGIDAYNHRFMIEYLKKWVASGERTIIFSSHNMPEIEDFCNRILIINGGKIVLDGMLSDVIIDNITGLKIKPRSADDAEKLGKLTKDLGYSMEHASSGYCIINCDKYINDIICDKMIENRISFDEITLMTESIENIYFRYTGQSISDIHN